MPDKATVTRGVATMTGTIDNITITAVDLAKTFVFVNNDFKSLSTSSARYMLTATLTSTTNLRIERADTDDSCEYNYTIVEFSSTGNQVVEMVTVTGTASATLNVTLSGSFPLINSYVVGMVRRTTGTDGDNYDQTLATYFELTTPTNLAITRNTGSTNVEFTAYIVKDPDCTVEQVSKSLTTVSTSTTINSVVEANTYLITNFTFSGTGDLAAREYIRCRLTSSTALNHEKGTAATVTLASHTYIINDSQATVQSFFKDLETDGDRRTNTTITALTLARSMTWANSAFFALLPIDSSTTGQRNSNMIGTLFLSTTEMQAQSDGTLSNVGMVQDAIDFGEESVPVLPERSYPRGNERGILRGVI